MKKIILFVFLSFSFFMKAQNYSITMYDTVKYGNPLDLLLPTVTLTNNTTTPVQMLLYRIVKDIPSGWTSCFCAPTCLPYEQDSLYFTISNGDNHTPTWQDVSPNFGTDTIPGVGVVVVVFTEVGTNVYDTVTFRGITSSPIGIKDYTNDNITISPNPASDIITLKNSNKKIVKIKLFNALGNEILKRNYNLDHEEIKIDISQYPSGSYSIIIDTSDKSFCRRFIKN